jgi:phosphoribosylformylglycinamidine (FGAM) synthase PurS component
MTADDQASAQDRLNEISQRLLANPVIESFQVEVQS